jgi:hypothetical protein
VGPQTDIEFSKPARRASAEPERNYDSIGRQALFGSGNVLRALPPDSRTWMLTDCFY